MRVTLEPLMDDQEHDTRASVGTVYWDGMVYVGTNDGNRGAGFAVRSSDGAIFTAWAMA